MYGGDGFWMFSDPADADYVYAESQGGHRRAASTATRTRPATSSRWRGPGEKLRFNWNTPLHLSPNEKGTLYIGAQFLFRTRDHGQSWERISPDLTTNDPQKQRQEESGGVTVDNSAAEMHTTIYSISESPSGGRHDLGGHGRRQRAAHARRRQELDQYRRTAAPGKDALPKASWVSWVEASRHDAATAYATFDRHTFGDFAPYLYVTRDYGKTWQPLVTPKNAQGRPRLRARHQGRRAAARPAVPRHGIRPVDLDRRRPSSGPSSRPTSSPPSRCATSRSSRATTTSCSPRTAAASGSSTTSRRCAR